MYDLFRKLLMMPAAFQKLLDGKMEITEELGENLEECVGLRDMDWLNAAPRYYNYKLLERGGNPRNKKGFIEWRVKL